MYSCDFFSIAYTYCLNFDSMEKEKQFVICIKQHKGLIYKVAALYTNGHQDRQDLIQEIVFQLWKSFDSYNESAKLSTWMYRVAMNTAIYNLKTRKKQVNTIPFEHDSAHFPDIEDQSEEERLDWLHARIQALNLLEKGIILLYLEGKTHQEISEIIGISVSNVGTKMSRIKEKIKTKITSDYGT